MQLQTNFDIPLTPCPIDHSAPILSIGSCFSAVMGQHLAERKFKVLNNPFGTLFNPLSLLHLLDISLGIEAFSEALFLAHDGRQLHYSCHSALSGKNKDDLKALLKTRCQTTQETLSKASWMIITFGTANIYEHRASGKIVSS